jgi:hypothetical protein
MHIVYENTDRFNPVAMECREKCYSALNVPTERKNARNFFLPVKRP